MNSIHNIAFHGNIETMKELINNNKNIELKDIKNNTPLLIACLGNKLEMIHYLLQLGANPNSLNKDNFSPLIYSIINKNKKAIKLLLDNGANPFQLVGLDNGGIQINKLVHDLGLSQDILDLF